MGYVDRLFKKKICVRSSYHRVAQACQNLDAKTVWLSPKKTTKRSPTKEITKDITKEDHDCYAEEGNGNPLLIILCTENLILCIENPFFTLI